MKLYFLYGRYSAIHTTGIYRVYASVCPRDTYSIRETDKHEVPGEQQGMNLVYLTGWVITLSQKASWLLSLEGT
jgi:hypothetical protein